MNSSSQPPAESIQLVLEPADTRLLANVCGPLNANLCHIEQVLHVTIHARGNEFEIAGESAHIAAARRTLHALLADAQSGRPVTTELVYLHLRHFAPDERDQAAEEDDTIENNTPKNHGGKASTEISALEQDALEAENVAAIPIIRAKKITIKPRGKNQQGYVRAVQMHAVNFGIGPAGTGKTYLAVACAVEALLTDKVSRILLVRPAVEAGEKLGFLPGDLAQKIDPYLRPLYDALYEMLGAEAVTKLIERNVIEIAPLAYMRGRTLNDSFIILDEAQNTTREQMKMFLTRIGFGSTAVITGDATQIDLPRGTPSGLMHAMNVLEGVKGISFTYFSARDVVRHPLVQAIVEAYEAFESENAPFKGAADKNFGDKTFNDKNKNYNDRNRSDNSSS